jgi:hypothetical protein
MTRGGGGETTVEVRIGLYEKVHLRTTTTNPWPAHKMEELVILSLCMLAARINSRFEQETKIAITRVGGNVTVCSYCGVHLGG